MNIFSPLSLWMTTFGCALCSLAPSAKASASVLAGIAPHRAVYDVRLSATHNGSQVANIAGTMTYALTKGCDGWTTDHHFAVLYEYADAPGLRMVSDFSSYESNDGLTMDYTARRVRNGGDAENILGAASLTGRGQGGMARYRMPEGLDIPLPTGTLFPVQHSVRLIDAALAGKPFVYAPVFDGSDEEGPVEINAVIGRSVSRSAVLAQNKKIEQSLLKSPAWSVRMAVFPVKDHETELADYEMSMVFHQNGIISDMTIDYDGFSVRQTLKELQSGSMETCTR